MSLKKNFDRLLFDNSIERHKYTDGLVKLAVSLVCGCGLGLRSAVKVLKLINNLFHLGHTALPCHNSIKNWIEKSGYFIYTHSELKSSGASYGIIIDESMQVGDEKLLLTLGVQADKSKESALRLNDVEVLDMSVSRSWNGALVSVQLDTVSQQMGQPPAYVISDNASIMKKGVRESSLKHLRDVGHSLAMFLERQYKDASEFLSMMKDFAKVKNREIMRPVAWLLPPKQRVIARFMNLTPCMQWARNMLDNFHKLSKEERRVFKFLTKHRVLINELNGMLDVFNHISKLLKENGLSHKTVKESIGKLKPLSCSPVSRVSHAIKDCINYLEEEKCKLATSKTVWHISSDILESLFGIYKQRKSPNALNGVTSYVLMLPLLTKSDPESGCVRIDFKNALEHVFLRDIDKWEKDSLSENRTVKRRKILNAA
jgi:hypothetical protein